jgi:hypothetical protein
MPARFRILFAGSKLPLRFVASAFSNPRMENLSPLAHEHKITNDLFTLANDLEFPRLDDLLAAIGFGSCLTKNHMHLSRVILSMAMRIVFSAVAVTISKSLANYAITIARHSSSSCSLA